MPPGDPVDLHALCRSHRTLLFSMSVLYSFSSSAYSSFCLRQCRAFVVASLFLLRLLFPPLSRSVGRIFYWIPIETSFIVCLFPQRVCMQRLISLALSLSLQLRWIFLFPLTFIFCCPFLLQGGPDAPWHAQAAGLHPLCVHLRHPLPHRQHPDAVRRCVHPRRRLHRAGTALGGQEVQRLARLASVGGVVHDPAWVKSRVFS